MSEEQAYDEGKVIASAFLVHHDGPQSVGLVVCDECGHVKIQFPANKRYQHACRSPEADPTTVHDKRSRKTILASSTLTSICDVHPRLILSAFSSVRQRGQGPSELILKVLRTLCESATKGAH